MVLHVTGGGCVTLDEDRVGLESNSMNLSGELGSKLCEVWLCSCCIMLDLGYMDLLPGMVGVDEDENGEHSAWEGCWQIVLGVVAGYMLVDHSMH